MQKNAVGKKRGCEEGCESVSTEHVRKYSCFDYVHGDERIRRMKRTKEEAKPPRILRECELYFYSTIFLNLLLFGLLQVELVNGL